MFRQLTFRRILPLLSTLIFVAIVGCGGGGEEPPLEPTPDQSEGLRKMMEAANQTAAALHAGQEIPQNDNFLIGFLMFISAKNGQVSDLDYRYLIWFLTNVASSKAQSFSGVPRQRQKQIMAQLGGYYQQNILGSSNPLVSGIGQQASQQTGLMQLFQGGF